ncbi:MAG: hypothetical protein ACOY46_20000 [Bacillota bacterium]
MKKSKKLVAMLVLLVSTVFVFNAMPVLAAGQPEDKPVLKGIEDRVIFISPSPILASDVHHQAYLTYLVMDYMPDSIEQWKEAFAERKGVMAKMPKPAVGVKKILMKKGDGEPAAPVKIKKSEPAISGGDKQVFIRKGMLNMTGPDEKTAEEIKASAELREEFESAVESGDAEDIKKVLPQLLEDYKRITAGMAEFVEKTQKSVDQ